MTQDLIILSIILNIALFVWIFIKLHNLQNDVYYLLDLFEQGLKIDLKLVEQPSDDV